VHSHLLDCGLSVYFEKLRCSLFLSLRWQYSLADKYSIWVDQQLEIM